VPDPGVHEVIHLIEVNGEALAAAIREAYFLRRPRDARSWDAAARRNYVYDTIGHLRLLCEALAAGEPILFAHQAAWARILLRKRHLSTKTLEATLECIATVLDRHVPPAAGSLCRSYIEAALARLRHPSAVEPQPVSSGQLSHLAKLYLDALLRATRRDATSLLMGALDAGANVRDIYLQVLQAAQYEIGRLWHMNKITIAQVHYCTAVTQSIISRLYPHVFSAERNGRRLVATCAEGEEHEIGIRMVSDFFEMEGWDTYYLGAGTPPKSVVRAIVEKRADLLLVSVTMALHLSKAKQLIGLVRGSDACRGIKVLLGGHTFNIVPNLWRKIGADGYARDANDAVAVAESLFESKSAAMRAADQAL
jgi:methanogenic corrinoid protein MtbC1